jgi:GNAT superfamily N-acetyltransferase
MTTALGAHAHAADSVRCGTQVAVIRHPELRRPGHRVGACLAPERARRLLLPGKPDGDAWLVESLHLDGRRFEIARASESDLPALVALLADDDLGTHRESTDFERYRMAFQEIDSDPRQLLVVVRYGDDVLVGTMQLTLIAGLARGGAKRLQIESVRVASSIRNVGLGTALLEWAHQYGRRHGATLAQLTSDKTRPNAHRFYDALGYQASHVGLKRPL